MINRVACVVTALALAAVIGCNQSPPGGNPPSAGGQRSTSFKISAPATTVTLKQGESEIAKLKLDRGKDFKEDVHLKFQPAEDAKGIKVDPTEAVVKAGDKEELSVKVSADKDAAIGNHTIHVTGMVETGINAPVDIKVTVKENK